MVGDFLQNTNGNVGQVVRIELYDGAIDEYDVAMRYSDNSTCYSSPKLLQPIPLTAEALEKNYFTDCDTTSRDRKMGNTFWYPGEGHYISDSDLMINLGDNGFLVRYGNSSIMHLKYVHELQHAFRLFGIEQQIEL